MVNDPFAAMLGFVCVILLILLVFVVFFLLTLQRALKYCARHNRTMEPGMVWLNLIPLFNLFWQFYTAVQVGNSLKNEFTERNLDDGSDYGKTIGIVSMALGIVSNSLARGGELGGNTAIALTGAAAGLLSFILLIVYWVRIYGYGTRLKNDGDRRFDRFDDFDDDDDPNARRAPSEPGSSDITARRRDDRYS